MAYDVSALSNYINEHKSDLIAAAVIAFKSSQYFQLMPGVKGATTLNLLNTPATFQSGESCGFNASGNVAFSQRTLTPGVIKVNEEFCPKALRTKYMQSEVMIGAGRDKMPFEEKITSELIANIGASMEVAFWQGDTSNGSGNNRFFNGLHTILAADVTNSVITNTLTAGGSDTILDRIKALVEIVPDNLGNKMTFFMNCANYRKLAMLLTYANLYHYQRDIDSNNLEMIFPGSDIKVVGVPGLTGIDRVYGLNTEEVCYGFDAEDDVENFDLWFSKDNDTYRFKAQWLAGTQYAFPNNVLVGLPNS
jgi:hypothetical protein